MNRYILNDNREPILCNDLVRWAKWYERFENRRVALHQVGDVSISTVFLGIDHQFASDGAPILFETLASGGPFGVEDVERYCTWAEAEAGHAAFMKRATP
jgi:hypothetical protein